MYSATSLNFSHGALTGTSRVGILSSGTVNESPGWKISPSTAKPVFGTIGMALSSGSVLGAVHVHLESRGAERITMMHGTDPVAELGELARDDLAGPQLESLVSG